MRSLSIIFKGDNLRYLTELRGSPLSRLFYNKATILLDEFGRFLSFYGLRSYFGPSIFVFLFPFWLIGFIEIIRDKRWRVLLTLFLAGIPVYLVDKREFISLVPITIVYMYITYLGFVFLTKKWLNKK